MSDPTPIEKLCPKCGEIKPAEAFSRNKHSKDGLFHRCKACDAAHYAANRDKVLARVAAYRHENPDKIRARDAEYRATHKEEKRARDAAYQKANPDRHLAAAARYRRNHPDRIRATGAAYYRNNPEKHQARRASNATYHRDYKIQHRRRKPDIYRASSARRRAKIRGNGGEGISPAELAAIRAAQNGVCTYCRLQYDPDTLHLDHIIPIAQGGLHDRSNTCLACPRCNLSKHDRTPAQWIRRWYHDLDLGRLM